MKREPKLKRYIYWFIRLIQWKIILEVKATNKKVTFQPSPDRYWADPFPVEYNGALYIFFEEHVSRNPGHLSAFRVHKDTLAIEQYYNNILNCKYHLSYPFVFTVDGVFYLMPESNKNKTLDIYRSVEWPHKWEKITTLLDNIVLSDTTLLRKDDLWWLFTTKNETGNYLESVNNLHIYYTNDIFKGQLTPHRNNPVKSDISSSRGAGYITVENGVITRPAQDCSDSYGGAIVFNTITALSTEEFSEVKTKTISPNSNEQFGVHTYNETTNYRVLDYLYRVSKIGLIFKNYKSYNRNKSFVKRFVSYPAYSDENSFISILNGHLANNGWTADSFNFSLRNLYKNRLKANVIYFHWPESIWRSANMAVSLLKVAKFTFLVNYAKLLGYKFAWSAHNTMPHRYKSAGIERFMRGFILRRFDLVINHSRNAKQEQFDMFGKTGKKSVDALHGHYGHHYQPGSAIDRRSLKIPDGNKVIYLNYNGQDYKGCDDFIKGYIKYNNANITLLISGAGVLSKFKPTPGVVLIDKFLDDSELADVMGIADVVSLPYKKITTSGFYFLAITFKKGILARDLPFFKQHSSPKTILLYNNDGDMEQAFSKIADGWQPDVAEIDALLEQFTWDKSSASIAEEFNDLIR